MNSAITAIKREGLGLTDDHRSWRTIDLESASTAWDFTWPVGTGWVNRVGWAVGGELVWFWGFEDDVAAGECSEQDDDEHVVYLK